MRVKQYPMDVNAQTMAISTIAITIKDQGNLSFATAYFMSKLLEWISAQEGMAFKFDPKQNPLRIEVCTDNWEIDA